MAAQVLLQRAVARLGVKSERREGVSGAGERVLRLLYSIVTKRGGRGVEIETAGAGTSIGISGESLFVIMTDLLNLCCYQYRIRRVQGSQSPKEQHPACQCGVRLRSGSG